MSTNPAHGDRPPTFDYGQDFKIGGELGALNNLPGLVAGLDEQSLRLVAWNSAGHGVTMAGYRIWYLHPITASLLRDSASVRKAVRRLFDVSAARADVAPDVFDGRVADSLDALAVILVRANYAITDEQAFGLLPTNPAQRADVRRVALGLVERVGRQVERDGGLFDGPPVAISSPFGYVPTRGVIPWPPEPQN